MNSESNNCFSFHISFLKWMILSHQNKSKVKIFPVRLTYKKFAQFIFVNYLITFQIFVLIVTISTFILSSIAIHIYPENIQIKLETLLVTTIAITSLAKLYGIRTKNFLLLSRAIESAYHKKLNFIKIDQFLQLLCFKIFQTKYS